MKKKLCILILILIVGWSQLVLVGCNSANQETNNIKAVKTSLTPSPSTPSQELTATRITSTASPLPPTATLVPPTTTPVPPTTTPSPTATEVLETSTPIPPLEAGMETEIHKDIVYANIEDFGSKLDIYVPQEAGPWPVVIVVHGFGQGKGAFAPLAEVIAAQGAVVYNIYTGSSPPPALPPAERLGCAVRFARKTASEYDGDPNQIIIVGNSAGASWGATVSLAGDEHKFFHCAEWGGPAIAEGFIGYEGIYELSATGLYSNLINHSYLKQSDPELYALLDPSSHVGSNPDLHIRLVHGTASDPGWYDIQPRESIGFYEALADAGYDVELSIVEGATHIDLTKPDTEAFRLIVHLVKSLTGSSQP